MRKQPVKHRLEKLVRHNVKKFSHPILLNRAALAVFSHRA